MTDIYLQHYLTTNIALEYLVSPQEIKDVYALGGFLLHKREEENMSIKKIAEKVGVSPATVSRVLNNPNYRCAVPGLRDKIWRTAIELNYVPNEAARNLKMGVTAKNDKTYYINVLMTRMDADQSDPFFTELLHVIESEIHKHVCILSKVWYMSLFSNDRKCRTENLDRIIDEMYKETEGRCDGLIIIGKCNKEALKKLNQRYKSVVSVNRNSTNYEVDEVLCDGKKIASMAVEYLIGLGHRNIGYVGECHNEARYIGYLETLQKHEIDLEPDYVIESKQTEAEGFEIMKRLLQLDDCPTGIYCANDITAVGMLKCLNKFKNRYYMPSIISSDDIEQAQYTNPMLTTVRLPKEEMGKFALYLLLDRMKGGHKGVVRTELEGKLMIRDSCTEVEASVWSDYYI
ncbi:MAG: substrate-binding domain-containing protein [Lachnospiraceae bacterium]